MAEWANKLDAFLQFNECNVLQDAGKISHDVAKSLAEVQYEKYSEQRRIDSATSISDFDALVDKAKTLPKNK
jgi:hypothetical protein